MLSSAPRTQSGLVCRSCERIQPGASGDSFGGCGPSILCSKVPSTRAGMHQRSCLSLVSDPVNLRQRAPVLAGVDRHLAGFLRLARECLYCDRGARLDQIGRTYQLGVAACPLRLMSFQCPATQHLLSSKLFERPRCVQTVLGLCPGDIYRLEGGLYGCIGPRHIFMRGCKSRT